MDRIQNLLGQRVSPRDLQAFCTKIMIKAGFKAEDARVTAEVLVTNDTWGAYTHGTRQLNPLFMNVRDGRISPQAVPEVKSERLGLAIVDGNNAMPMVSSSLAMETAISKAKTSGVAYVGVAHSSHFGTAGYYATMALKEDMIGVSMGNADPWMTVPGGRGKIMGANPIAYAIPAGEEWPVFLDIATSTVAVTKIMTAKTEGKAIPETWWVDQDGIPTSDLSDFPEKGAVLPMAGHKGYGLALLVETLAGVLAGAAILSEVKCWVGETPEPSNQGHAFIAIDVGAIMPIHTFKCRMDKMIQEIKSSPKAKGSDRIYLPGEKEWEAREVALKEGMQLPAHVIMNLDPLAKEFGLDREFEAIFQ